MEFHLEAPDSWPMSLAPTNGGSGEVCEKKTFSMERKNGEAVFVRGRHLCCVPSYTGDTRLSWLSSDYEALFYA